MTANETAAVAADACVERVRVRPVLAPLKRPPRSASGEIPVAPLVLIDLYSDRGAVGSAYLFAFTPMMLRPLCECVEALAGQIAGAPLAPLDLDDAQRRRLRLMDTPGLIGLALAGLDMAVWDAHAKLLGVPLARALGAGSEPVRAYNSCGLWIKDPAALADEAEQLVAEGGFGAVKLRLGRPDFRADLTAVRNVRKRLPEDIALMSDFNQSLTLSEALRRCRALDDEGLYWFEEPIRHDDYAGYARLAGALRTPLQTGENLLGTLPMRDAIAAGAAAYYMPDVQRIGGVSGWLRAAGLAHAHGLEMSSHLFPEYSRHLLAATPTRHWLEYVDWADAILQQPVTVKNGRVPIPPRPGSGIVWDEGAVRRYAPD